MPSALSINSLTFAPILKISKQNKLTSISEGPNYIIHILNTKILMHTILKVFRKITLSFRLISVSFSNGNCTVHKYKWTCTLLYTRSNMTIPWITPFALIHRLILLSVTTICNYCQPVHGRRYCRYGIIQFTFLACVYISLLFLFSVEEKWRYWRSKINDV